MDKIYEDAKASNKSKSLESKKKEVAGKMKHEVKEKHEKDYNDRNRSWDVKNRFHGGGVGGNTI